MTERALFLTTGGSHQPLVTAIQSIQPTQVVFFCTDRDPATGRPGSRTQVEGKGTCIKASFQDDKPSLPNIPTQCGLNDDRWTIRIVPADDFDAAFSIMCQAMNESTYAELEKLADYTGGTKTMTAALVVAALETPGVELQLVAGSRTDLNRTRDGTQEVIPATVERVRFARDMNLHLSHWRDHNYAAAVQGMRQMSPPTSPELRAQRQRALHVSEAFEAWDRFDHQHAWERLEQYRQPFSDQFAEHFSSLQELAGHGRKKNNDVLRLWDLWLNAERRAKAHRFDDATARLYRLLEWTAQLVLQHEHGWSTSDLPNDIAEAAGIAPGPGGTYQTGLRGAWSLIAEHCPGPWLQFHQDQGETMMNHVRKRNHSILAHGSEALAEADWLTIWGWTTSQFRPLLERLARDAGYRRLPPQLPDSYPDIGQ